VGKCHGPRTKSAQNKARGSQDSYATSIKEGEKAGRTIQWTGMDGLIWRRCFFQEDTGEVVAFKYLARHMLYLLLEANCGRLSLISFLPAVAFYLEFL
jgi:hypothetical protein